LPTQQATPLELSAIPAPRQANLTCSCAQFLQYAP